jgi:exodeoxyribonuclease VII large subunit
VPDLWTVSALTRYVKQMLETDYRLQDLRVSGEISGFRAYPSGHWYFTLKDSAAQVSCVMWRGRAERMRYTPRDGDAVVAVGNAGLYEARGQFQLDVITLQPAGEGVLYREFVRLKEALEAEGLFDPARKRPLPGWPRRIGVVTSPKAAALRDILNILRRRFPLAEVILSPTPVQGADAPPYIVLALQACAAQSPDVILLARGGGSLEDLWCFNDERVVRAVAACPVPVISGVGHETDFTLSDFAADLRAPTPSAAAELATPDRAQIADDVLAQAARLADAVRARLGDQRWALSGLQTQLRGLSPLGRVRAAQQRVDDLQARALAALGYGVSLQRARFQGLRQSLLNVSPVAVLARGYAVVSTPEGRVIRRASDVQPGDPLRVRVAEGEFGATASPRSHEDTKERKES